MKNPTIAEILTLPDKSALNSIQAKVTEVFNQRSIAGGKTVQDIKVQDSTGELKLTVWEHPDLKGHYDGAQVEIQAGPKGGLTVAFDGYKGRNVNTVSVSRTCTFKRVQVGGSPAPAQSAQRNDTPRDASTLVNGAKVGMLINNACLFMTNAGEQFSAKRVAEIASELKRVSDWLEAGNLTPKAGAAAAPAPAPVREPDPAPAQNLDEDVPF